MFTRVFLPLIALSLVAACGGASTGGTGTGGSAASYVSLSNTASTERSDIRTHTVSAQAQTDTVTAVYDRATDRISVAGLNGSYDAARRALTMDDGSIITLSATTTDYVVAFSAEPATGSAFSGVFGVPTVAGTLPSSGTLRYTGTNQAVVQIVDGDNSYDLRGKVDAVVTFGARGLVDVTISQLGGTRTDGLNPMDVSNVAVIHLDDAALVNGAFSGGSVRLTESQLSALSDHQLVSTSGGLFGPNGDEIGGVFLIDDTSGTASLLIQGWYTAD